MKNRLFSRVDLLFSCFSGSTSETLPKDSLRTPQRYTIGGREIQEEKLLSEGLKYFLEIYKYPNITKRWIWIHLEGLRYI